MLEEPGMMMVPSSFLAQRPPNGKYPPRRRRPATDPKPINQDENRTSQPNDPPIRARSALSLKIPSQADRRIVPAINAMTRSRPESPTQPRLVAPSLGRKAYSAGSVESLLAATSIPVRRKPKSRKSQRLPDGDHVVDFSRLLSEDMQSREESSLSGSLGNPQLDVLFGTSLDNLEEAMFVGSEDTCLPQLSIRSLSSDSVPSLEMDEDSTALSFISATTPSPSSATRRSSYRRSRLFSSSEACSEDHPLNFSWEDDPKPINSPDSGRWSPEVRKDDTPKPSPPKPRSSFRSNLTASLRAIQSAAQTLSNFATTTPMNKPDDFLTRSIFTFYPELTDDKRPPPSAETPSPALRRYLNPDRRPLESHSPSEFYSYSENPTVNIPSSRTPDIPNLRPNFPASIQLQTCLPPATRSPTGSASSPPRFGPGKLVNVNIRPSSNPSPPRSSTRPPTTDGEEEIRTTDELVYNAHTSFHASPNVTRQREPRENPDFLRILVCEMQMRRKGKFEETAEGRASIWLPPRREVSAGIEKESVGRWKSWSAEDL